MNKEMKDPFDLHESQKTNRNKILFAIGGIGIVVLIIMTIWFIITIPDVSPLKKSNPQTTALIEQRINEAKKNNKKFYPRQRWVSFTAIPDLLKKSIRISEDSNFYYHEGIDSEELIEAIKKNWQKGEFVRGASTITQQLAKNLYLSTDKSLFRKLKEYFITRKLEKELSKNRIFQIYLNIIEFAPGVFGVEAASNYYFNKSVSDLNLEEIIRLTAVIPRPLSIRANGSSRWLFWRCRWILNKLKLYKYIDKETYESMLPVFN